MIGNPVSVIAAFVAAVEALLGTLTLAMGIAALRRPRGMSEEAAAEGRLPAAGSANELARLAEEGVR